jgi:hypothetical protein
MPDLIPVLDDHSHPLVKRVLSEAFRCLQCGAPHTSLTIMSESRIVAPRYLIACRECKFEGEFGKTLYQALHLWNCPSGPFVRFIKKWLGR